MKFMAPNSGFGCKTLARLRSEPVAAQAGHWSCRASEIVRHCTQSEARLKGIRVMTEPAPAHTHRSEFDRFVPCIGDATNATGLHDHLRANPEIVDTRPEHGL